MPLENDHLYHGSEWAEYEDLLVGNRIGLEKLRIAIDEALDTGESEINVGEFLGVRCLESEFFEKNRGNVNTFGSYVGFGLFGIAFICTVLIVWLAKSS